MRLRFEYFFERPNLLPNVPTYPRAASPWRMPGSFCHSKLLICVKRVPSSVDTRRYSTSKTSTVAGGLIDSGAAAGAPRAGASEHTVYGHAKA